MTPADRIRAMIEAAEEMDGLADREDALAITCPEADVYVHREREGAFKDAAKHFRALAAIEQGERT